METLKLSHSSRMNSFWITSNTSLSCQMVFLYVYHHRIPIIAIIIPFIWRKKKHGPILSLFYPVSQICCQLPWKLNLFVRSLIAILVSRWSPSHRCTYRCMYTGSETTNVQRNETKYVPQKNVFAWYIGFWLTLVHVCLRLEWSCRSL